MNLIAAVAAVAGDRTPTRPQLAATTQDLQIAAAGARHDLMLLTRNGSSFTGLQSALKIVDLPDLAPGTVGQERCD